MGNNSKVSGIYCIENNDNGKKYFGKGEDISARWKNHRSAFKNNRHWNKHMQRAYNLYGKDIFSFYVVEECDPLVLIEREKYYIKLYKTTNNKYGYNMTEGGDGLPGWIPSLETRNKISMKTKGQTRSKETKNNLSLSHLGKKRKPFSKECIEKMSFSHLLENLSEETIQKYAACNMNKKRKVHSSEYHGVFWDKSRNLWMAHVGEKNKQKNIGRFKKEKDAAKAFDMYVVENSLPNQLNFPEKYVNGVYNVS